LAAHHRFGSDDGPRAGPVLDDERLSQRFLQALGNEPAIDIRRPARRKRDDDLHWFGRVILCRCKAAECGDERNERDLDKRWPHGESLLFSPEINSTRSMR
jgi:hypothetical protein